MTLSNFIEQCEGRGILATLARAVINSTGGWASFKESAPDITNHGKRRIWRVHLLQRHLTLRTP